MAKEKAMNYTPEMESEIRATLAADVDQKTAIVDLAERFGKSVASVRQKAVRMGLYRKAEYVGKTGAKPESKESISGEIAELLGVNVETAESLAKANKKILMLVRDALRAHAIENED